MNDAYNLQRFIDAQAGIYESVLSELRAGRKRGHWIWYIFPQIDGLGSSAMSLEYAIKSQGEAKAYLEHPLLGERLRECTQLVLNLEGLTAQQIFSYPDTLKFRSCMTLFDRTACDSTIFRDALVKYFGGEPDPLTLDLLQKKAD
ncbi:DUF1810 domain-containing protein [Crenobacter sp. SG2303]|uniref:DUF1810 domain-containing protein n=1 Tax=Crenobacter oryzisoli TaxID=3056844 RepID=A0ABT7XPG6_9NEIS|nr:DUF1810 domain-containing protein [Crenobacter sp. SG2303]MDN0075694.1 DUF1810 domain-containing protein [Crenobacter sp. SG2303]